MSQVNLNGAVLKKIANASHTAEVVMTDMALRERVRPFSDIQRTRNRLIREGERIEENDYKKFWKDLQDTGAGVIVYGRKGQPDRFQWHYSMKKVAEAALVGKDLSAKAAAIAKEAKVPAKAPSPTQAQKPVTPKFVSTPRPSETREVTLQVRPNFFLDFCIPKDLTKAEAEAISVALRRFAA